ncbi:hypothetical protein H6P81_019165 [Aristolochia fimbriata]|uniref:VQ domain-containing protein n=1 Tax=Aristolochia fimbriata TaxID=158543 RepID=A0AAV7DSG3_ARIFI|nr:hypothetical protein H6P81_019165 [Aristolochia fimbriata]
MAMSETPSKPIDWAQFYHLSSPPPPSSAAAESIVVTTTATTQSANPGAGGGSYAQIEGRVGKSGRRRSRASRRAPTTLLNTDTTNFRAMVQQFTGVPTVPFSSNNTTYQPSVAAAGGMGFGFGAQHRRGQPAILPRQNNNNNNSSSNHACSSSFLPDETTFRVSIGVAQKAHSLSSSKMIYNRLKSF